MGEEYHRMTPLPNFPSKTHGAVPPTPVRSRVGRLKGGRRPVSGWVKVFALPGPKWALNRRSDTQAAWAYTRACGRCAHPAQHLVVSHL